MIKGKAKMEFGSGDIRMTGALSNGVGALCCIAQEPHEIGEKVPISGELLDVGICAEDEDGDRFWCHFKSDSVEVMKRRYERYQEYMKAGKISEYNDFEVECEYLDEKENTANGGCS